MNIAKKLYYSLLTATTSQLVGLVKFVAGTGQDFGSAAGTAGINGVTPDSYLNVMAPNAFNGVTLSDEARTRQAIRAWLQCASLTLVYDATTFADVEPQVCCDFIAPQADTSTAAILAAARVDPTSVRRPWLRIRNPAGPSAQLVGTLRVYIDRQHSLEV